MIIGTIALLNLLFFGGIQEYFLLDKLEKGVKSYVEDKDRRKEILTDLKTSKAIIKSFNKERKSKLKVFKEMNLDRNTRRQDAEKYFQDRQAELIQFQKKIIMERLTIIEKFSQEEWDNILAFSAEEAESRMSKEIKKAKDPFNSVIDQINKSITDSKRQDQAISILEEFKNKFDAITLKVSSLNASDNKILQNRNSTFDDLEAMTKETNALQKVAINAFIDLHFEMKEVTNESEWDKIIKEFNKIIN